MTWRATSGRTIAASPGAGSTAAAIAATHPARRRICVVSDDLSGAPDEGVKKFTLALSGALRADHEVAVLSARGPVVPPGVAFVPAPRSFASPRLRAAIRRHDPALVIYAARSSATFFGFARAWLLGRYAPGARLVLLGLQTRRHPAWQRRLIRALRPDLVAVQSAANADYLAALGCRVALLPSGVDLATFHPADTARREALRRAHNLDPARPVILHVGHLEAGRGIGVLADLARGGEAQVVLVTSSSTLHQANPALRQELAGAGVRVISSYLPRIEEVYQLATVYVFPVRSTDNAIEAPLSVLEALACDLPVVTTRYGGLPRLFADTVHPGLVFVDGPEELIAAAGRLTGHPVAGTRPLVAPYGWDHIAETLVRAALAPAGAPAALPAEGAPDRQARLAVSDYPGERR